MMFQMRKETRKNVTDRWVIKMIKGMVKLMVGVPLVGAVLSGIGGAGMGAIGGATQSLVSIGFMGHAIKESGAKKLFK